MLGGLAALATATLVFGSTGEATAMTEGPVLYLNTHGAPTDCDVSVDGTLEDGGQYHDTLNRQSCDGTLWMPALRSGTDLHVEVHVVQPRERSLEHDFTVENARDESLDDVDNATAVCFLVKALGKIAYTNMSAKGGQCNGA